MYPIRGFSDFSLTDLIRNKTKDVATGINTAVSTIKTPTVTVTIDDKTKNTAYTAMGILAFGLIVSAFIKR